METRDFRCVQCRCAENHPRSVEKPLIYFQGKMEMTNSSRMSNIKKSVFGLKMKLATQGASGYHVTRNTGNPVFGISLMDALSVDEYNLFETGNSSVYVFETETWIFQIRGGEEGRVDIAGA